MTKIYSWSSDSAISLPSSPGKLLANTARKTQIVPSLFLALSYPLLEISHSVKWLNSKSRKEGREARHPENHFSDNLALREAETLYLSVSQQYLLFICSELRKTKTYQLLEEGPRENDFINPYSFILNFLTSFQKTIIYLTLWRALDL